MLGGDDHGDEDDHALVADLHATATDLAEAGADVAAATTRLKHQANGRTDLLAEAAGRIIGESLANPERTTRRTSYSAALLLAAGADPDRVTSIVDARLAANESSEPTAG